MLEDSNNFKNLMGKLVVSEYIKNAKIHTMRYNIDIEVSYCKMCQYIKIKKFSVSKL